MKDQKEKKVKEAASSSQVHCFLSEYQEVAKTGGKDTGHNQMPLMEYYSAIKKNTFESVLMRWMKLEPIIQSEVSQKEKHQYSILTHIYGI